MQLKLLIVCGNPGRRVKVRLLDGWTAHSALNARNRGERRRAILQNLLEFSDIFHIFSPAKFTEAEVGQTHNILQYLANEPCDFGTSVVVGSQRTAAVMGGSHDFRTGSVIFRN